MFVTLDSITVENDSIKTFRFKPEKPVKYEAGQFVEVQLPHDHPDNRGQKRWFTLSSSPTEEYLSITTKFTPEGGSTFKHMFSSLEIGHKMLLSSPMGDFVLPKDVNLPLVFVAGGIGVTPMRSMVKYLSDNKQVRDITLIYSANTLEEFAFIDLFATTAGVSLTQVVTNPSESWRGESGRLTSEKILELAKDPTKSFYISGPEPMVEVFEKGLKSGGVKKIITDYFPGYTA